MGYCGGLGDIDDQENFKSRLRVHSYLYTKYPDEYSKTFEGLSLEELMRYHDDFNVFSDREYRENFYLRKAHTDLEEVIRKRKKENSFLTRKE